MSIVDTPAFLLDLLWSAGVAVLLQHFGDCSSGDLQNVSIGDEGTVEEPAAAMTCGMLAFRSHLAMGASGRALASSLAASHGAFQKGQVWPCLAWGQ